MYIFDKNLCFIKKPGNNKKQWREYKYCLQKMMP